MKLDVRLPLFPPDDHECRKRVLILTLVFLSTTTSMANMGVLEPPKVLYLGYWNTRGCATPDVLHALDLETIVLQRNCYFRRKTKQKTHCAQQTMTMR